jgi:putative ABC transport system permease protein
MRTRLAWHNLAAEKLRTAVAMAGVAFALTLVFLQLGFCATVDRSARLLLETLDFDLALVSVNHRHLTMAGTFPKLRLTEARSVPGVAGAYPVYIGLQSWRTGDTRKNRAVMVVGIRPEDRPFRALGGNPDLGPLQRPGTVLLDEWSDQKFKPRDVRAHPYIGGRRVTIAGTYRLGHGFAADGTILVGDRTFGDLLGGYPLDRVSLGLIRLRRDQDPATVAGTIARAIGPARHDVRVLTRAALLDVNARYWLWEKSIGIIFLFGVGVAAIVGVVVLGQVLTSDIIDHVREYATLKAIGYRNADLRRVVLEQALILALAGYVPACAAALGLFGLTRSWTNLPIDLTPAMLLLVLGAAILMSGLAALGAIRKVTAADPASNLF